jgi:methyl coenzyme M reductase alpha subunit
MTAAEMTNTVGYPFRALCRAFPGEPAIVHDILVEQDGTVLVWDEYAGHYTTNHDIAPAVVRRLRNHGLRQMT